MDSGKQGKVRLGLLAPLTGLVKMYGQEICHAAQIACQEINEAGGILGRPLEIVIEDDGSLPVTAVPAAVRLIEQHGCTAIIGNLLSNSRIAVANTVAEPRRVPLLNFSFYEGSIYSRYFFHFAALPNQQIEKMIPFMVQKFGPKAFFAGNNYEWPHGSIDAARRSLQSCGGEEVGSRFFDIGSSDFSDLFDELARSGADFFVPYAAGEDQLNLLRQFYASGLKGRMAVVMGHYDEAMVAALEPEVREGLYSSNTYFMGINSPANRRYLQRLGELSDVDGIWPNGNGILTNFGEGTFLCVKAFAAAAASAHTLDREALVQALENVSVDAPQGLVLMDPVTHHAHVNSYLSVCQADGSFKIVERFGRVAPEVPERYRAAFELWRAQAPLKLVAARASGSESQRSSVQGMRFDFERIAVAIVDENGRVCYSSEEIERAFNIGAGKGAPSELTNYLLNPQEFHEALTVAARQGRWVGELFVRKDGDNRLLLVCLERMNAPAKASADALYILQCFDPLRDYQQHFSFYNVLKMADVAIIVIDSDAKIVQANPRAEQMFGYGVEGLVGLGLNVLLPPHLRDVHSGYVAEFMRSSETARSMTSRDEIMGYRKDGSFFPARAGISKIDTMTGRLMVVSLMDISDEQKQNQRLQWEATHDRLTRLPNRALISDRLQNSLERAVRAGHKVALIFIDVDNFKMINDTYGHEVGDRLLLEVAERLLTLVRPGDTVGRFSGDEFLVICDPIDQMVTATKIVDRIVNHFTSPISLGDLKLFVTVSAGLTIGEGGGVNAETLLKNADAAMYQAKQEGRDTWVVYDETINDRSRRQLQIVNGLKTALVNQEFYLAYQPIVHAASGAIVGCEALLRWELDGKPVPPDEFIPVAEHNGSIIPIGLWVFEQACRALNQWKKVVRATQVPYISVNVSARQFSDPDLVHRFADILQRTGVEASNIVLEVTETALIDDMTLTLDVLNKLGRTGFGIAIDDFGVGYSSLSQLTNMPIDILKIDKAFVRDLAENSRSLDIARAIIQMAQALKLKVTAEGVEDKVQLSILRQLGCDNTQGYFFSRPVILEDLLPFLKYGLDIAI